jgi:DNA-directed RNA polymerase specialized sigma24 family protein
MHEVSDDELIFLVRQKQEEAFDILFSRLKSKQERMVKKLLFEHRYCGLDERDLLLVAMQTLYLAIDSYDPSKAVFDAYYHILLQRELVNEMKKFNSGNHVLLNTALSLDEPMDDQHQLYDMIGAEDDTMYDHVYGPTRQLLEDEHHPLTIEEKTIITYFHLGYSYSEIGRLIQKNYRYVSKVVQMLYEKFEKM